MSENRYIGAVNRGLGSLIPIVLVGAFLVALLNLPIPAFQNFMDRIADAHWRSVSLLIYDSTINIIGLAALFAVSYALAIENPLVRRGEANPIIIVILTFSCYIILLVWDDDALIFHRPGPSGLFYSLVLSIVVERMFTLFANIRQKIGGAKASIFNSNLVVRSSFRAILPVFCTLLVFALLRLLIQQGQWDVIAESLFRDAVEKNLTSDSFLSVMLVVLLTQACWFLGIHGGNLIMDNLPNRAADVTGAASNLFVTKDFFDLYIYIGGTGATLGLLAALFIAGSLGKGKRIARISLFPAAFNINEPLLYSLPVIFNPFLLVPFILAPVTLGAVAYVALSLGLVPNATHSVQWTTPVFMSGYLASGSVAGALLQGFNLVVATLFYLPFVRMNKRYAQDKRLQDFKALAAAAFEAAENEYISLVARNDRVGELAREFVTEIHGHFASGVPPFHLEYQPKTDSLGRVVGAEALLRWNHPEYGYISPVMLIEMTDEAGLSTQLGRWIFLRAVQEFSGWRKIGIDGISISINLNPRHLREDAGFADYVKKTLADLELPTDLIELEITEHMAISSGEAAVGTFRSLRASGVALSIDDLGMGYSSLTYITTFDAGTVKIDASLVRDIDTDAQEQEIVRSIVGLADNLKLEIIVEGVERREQVDALLELGCQYFQGYYFSRPLPPEKFVAYAKEHRLPR
jgi:lactose/cellobiose-specific phosphotransferase system IIC component